MLYKAVSSLLRLRLETYFKGRGNMVFKFVTVLCAIAISGSSAVLAPTYYGGAYGNPYSAYPAQPALATQQYNIIRSPYNLGQISTFSKTVDTPYSSVSKSDVRVSNPGIAYGGYAAPAYAGYAAPAYAGYAAPAYAGYGGYAAPTYHGYASPLLSHGVVSPVAKVATAGGLLGVAYSAAPAVSHMTYSNGLGLAYAW